MHPFRRIFTFVVLCASLPAAGSAQEAEDRTLLPVDQLRAIVNEASGERALHHVLELVPYPRVRPVDEYRGTFRESEVMARFAREYGFSDVSIESFPSGGALWQPTRGELWMVEPEVRKLYDIYDIAIALAGNSESGDVTAEVVDVGTGARPQDYEGRTLDGKIVLGSAGPGTLQRHGVFDRGAAGVVSYTSLRPDDYPDQILSSGISSTAPDGATPGFGWVVSPRVARELSAIISSGRKVVLRSIITAVSFPGELEVVHATIPGDGSSDQLLGVSAHLYEGYIKQGANDDASGCGLTLEMGRAYIRLIAEGKLPRPKRTIHFLWVPEISGTNAWLNKYPDIKKRMIANLNFDMEGIRLSTNRAYWVLHRTPDTFPSFLNDVSQSLMEWASEVNRERVRYRANGYRPSLPIVSPNGSQDPFTIKIDKHYGASDHVTYMQHGIPSVMFITWPDMYYHSSQDIPQQLDPTQFRRGAVVGIAAMSVIASADDPVAARVAAESFTRGTERMGEAQRKGFGYMADAATAEGLHTAYKEARNAVRHQAGVEKEVVRTAAVLFAKPDDGRKRLEPLAVAIAARSETLLNETETFYRLRAWQMGSRPQTPAPTASEKDAARTRVSRGPSAGGGFRAMRAAMEQLSDAERTSMGRIPQHMTAELNILVSQNRTLLEIRDFLSGEFEPLPLADLAGYIAVMEKIGMAKTEKK